NGTLRIIDRKKHIFKLSQGEYIAPEKIENVYMRSTPVLQVFVHGDSLQSYLIGVVVPDPEVFAEWTRERGIVGSYEELCQNPDVKKAVLEDMTAVGKEAGLKSFEQVKDLHLHPEVFSVSNGLLTPTLKSRRADIRRFFLQQISHMSRPDRFCVAGKIVTAVSDSVLHRKESSGALLLLNGHTDSYLQGGKCRSNSLTSAVRPSEGQGERRGRDTGMLLSKPRDERLG
ncbi:long-chain-fatty-acid-CoA ligase 1-like, partial [Arapaima gigas]